MARHYLDYASTAPLRPAARDAMVAALNEGLDGDAGRIHADGLTVRAHLEDARDHVARFFGARGREVVFTGSASEAIAQATWGATERGSHIVLSAVEHSAVRLSSQQFGSDITIVGCNRVGRIDPDEIVAAIRPDTAVVHVQWANHEVGTVQPVADIVRACRERHVLVHVDAAQAAGRVPIDFGEVGADLMSICAHKHGGPPGIGALLIRRGVRLRSLIRGAEQERGRRAGLEPTVLALGWAAALDSIDINTEAMQARRHSQLVRDIVDAVGDTVCFGDEQARLDHLVCASVGGIEPQAVLIGHDQRGISIHSGSACASEDLQPSPVLEAMGVDAHRSLRISVGWGSNDDDIGAFAAAFAPIVQSLRALQGSPPRNS
jgi:cysteine desulfurase